VLLDWKQSRRSLAVWQAHDAFLRTTFREGERPREPLALCLRAMRVCSVESWSHPNAQHRRRPGTSALQLQPLLNSATHPPAHRPKPDTSGQALP
jgi:hypothetical protein